MPAKKKRAYSKENFQRWYANPENAAKQKANAKKARKKSLARNREFIRNYKAEQQCQECGESESCCLDFHHKKGTKKVKAVADMISAFYSVESIKKEIAKCVVVCKNCHAKIHAGILGD